MIRDDIKKTLQNYVADNWQRWNELTHTSHCHVWVEIYPDGKYHETEEPDDYTKHYIGSPGKRVESILHIASSNDYMCDCDVCHALKELDEYKKGYITADEYKALMGFDVKDIDGQDLYDVLYDYDFLIGQDDFVEQMEMNLAEIPCGYFDDEI